MNLTDRQKMLLEIACKSLDILGDYGISDEELSNILKYNSVEQDVGCLADDIRIEFELEEKECFYQ